MARPVKENERKTILGEKLDALRNNIDFDEFASFFGVSGSTLSRFRNGDGNPSLEQLKLFVTKYAVLNDGQRVDLNWLADDTDLRFKPVFVINWRGVAKSIHDDYTEVYQAYSSLHAKCYGTNRPVQIGYNPLPKR